MPWTSANSLLAFNRGFIAARAEFVEQPTICREARLGPVHQIDQRVGRARAVEKSDHVLNEPVNFVEAGKDIEPGPFGLNADVGDLIAQDAKQFFVMAEFTGNQHHFRGDGVEPTHGMRVRWPVFRPSAVSHDNSRPISAWARLASSTVRMRVNEQEVSTADVSRRLERGGMPWAP